MLVTFALMLGVCNVGEFDSKASDVDVNMGTATDEFSLYTIAYEVCN